MSDLQLPPTDGPCWFNDAELQKRLEWDVLFELAFAKECPCGCREGRDCHLSLPSGEIEYIGPVAEA